MGYELSNLMEDKGKLEAILSAIGEGIVIIDLNKKIIFENDRALLMFGDFVGKSCFSLYNSEDSPCGDCPAAFCIKYDTIKTAVHSSIDPDGNLKYYELTVAPVKEDGKIIASVEIIRDITERTLLEEELHRATRRMGTVISKMRYGLVYANRRNEVAIGNELGLDFFSLKINDNLDSDDGTNSNPNTRMLKKVINAFRDDSKLNSFESNVQKEGKWYNVGYSASRSSTDRYYGTIVNITDITNMKKFEELKENLTNMIVHDMKNPLSTILYVLEMAAEGMIKGIDPASEKLFVLAHNDSKHLLSMIHGMLDISKMEEGEQILDLKESYYKSVIKKSVAQVDILAKARGIAIKEIYTTTRVALTVDEGYLERIITNLLGNAIKFAEEGSQILTMVDDYEKDGKKYLKFSVVNESSKNIPGNVLKTIFDKFKQAERRSSGKIASTGLGLTFCKLAVESHGGEIWVTSPPEEYEMGAKFSFTIPIVQED